MKVIDWIGLGIGIYAAIAATIVLVWDIRRNHPHVSIAVGYESVPIDTGTSELLILSVKNWRQVPIRVTNYGLIGEGVAVYQLGCGGYGTEVPTKQIKAFSMDFKKLTEATTQDMRYKYSHAFIGTTIGQFKGKLPLDVQRIIRLR